VASGPKDELPTDTAANVRLVAATEKIIDRVIALRKKSLLAVTVATRRSR
jgi:hypothetical protein